MLQKKNSTHDHVIHRINIIGRYLIQLSLFYPYVQGVVFFKHTETEFIRKYNIYIKKEG